MAFQPPPKHSLRARRGGFQQTSLALVLGVAVTSLLFGVASCSKEEKRAVQREVVLQTATFPGAHPWTSDLTSVAVPTEGEATSPVTPSGGPATPVDVSGTQPELYGGVTGVPALDRDKLVTDLDANPPMAAAWRTAAGTSDVNGYVNGIDAGRVDSRHRSDGSRLPKRHRGTIPIGATGRHSRSDRRHGRSSGTWHIRQSAVRAGARHRARIQRKRVAYVRPNLGGGRATRPGAGQIDATTGRHAGRRASGHPLPARHHRRRNGSRCHDSNGTATTRWLAACGAVADTSASTTHRCFTADGRDAAADAADRCTAHRNATDGQRRRGLRVGPVHSRPGQRQPV